MTFSVGKLMNVLRFWIADSDIEQWFEERNVFFVSGMGRSGTKFLARLLNADDSAVVFHEPLPEDFEAIVAAQQKKQAAREYVEEFRKKRIYSLVRKRDVTTYGEVNSAIRYHLKALSKAFPSARILHLTRDGRNVVRSLMSRRHYTVGGEGHHWLSPNPGEPLAHRWVSLSRFEKVCWLWSDAVTKVEESAQQRVRLERLVEDYGYFHKNIEMYLGVQVGEELWQREIVRPSNETSRHAIPHWTEWTPDRRKQFEEICGEQMRKLGYW